MLCPGGRGCPEGREYKQERLTGPHSTPLITCGLTSDCFTSEAVYRTRALTVRDSSRYSCRMSTLTAKYTLRPMHSAKKELPPHRESRHGRKMRRFAQHHRLWSSAGILWSCRPYCGQRSPLASVLKLARRLHCLLLGLDPFPYPCPLSFAARCHAPLVPHIFH